MDPNQDDQSQNPAMPTDDGAGQTPSPMPEPSVPEQTPEPTPEPVGMPEPSPAPESPVDGGMGEVPQSPPVAGGDSMGTPGAEEPASGSTQA